MSTVEFVGACPLTNTATVSGCTDKERKKETVEFYSYPSPEYMVLAIERILAEDRAPALKPSHGYHRLTEEGSLYDRLTETSAARDRLKMDMKRAYENYDACGNYRDLVRAYVLAEMML